MPGTTAAKKPTVTLEQLRQMFGWDPATSTEYKLLRAACAKKATDSDAQITVTVAALDKYLAKPADGVYVSSKLLVETERKIAKIPAPKMPGQGPQPPAGLRIVKTTPTWQAAADANGDKILEVAELHSYYEETAVEGPRRKDQEGNELPFDPKKDKYVRGAPKSEAAGRFHVTDQYLDVLRHQIAMSTKETDYLAVRDYGKADPTAARVRTYATGSEYQREYYYSIFDEKTRQPRMVAWKLTNADISERINLSGKRKSVEKFYDDPELAKLGKKDPYLQVLGKKAWYATKYNPYFNVPNPNPDPDPTKPEHVVFGKNGRVDKGHQWPLNDYTSWDAAQKTFNMINMSGQSWPVNEGPWRIYEDAINSTIASIDGSQAFQFVSNGYLASDGKLQTEEGEVRFYEKDVTTLDPVTGDPVLHKKGEQVMDTMLRWYGPDVDKRGIDGLPASPHGRTYKEDTVDKNGVKHQKGDLIPDSKAPNLFALPTSCLKAVLIQLPDGKWTATAVDMPNVWDKRIMKEPRAHEFIEASRISIDEFEKRTGMDVALPDGTKLTAKMKGKDTVTGKVKPVEQLAFGADLLIPYYRKDINGKDRGAIIHLFPLGAKLPDYLDPAKTTNAGPVGEEETFEEEEEAESTATPPAPPPPPAKEQPVIIHVAEGCAAA